MCTSPINGHRLWYEPWGQVIRVEKLRKSVRDVAKLLDVAPIHVSDIETGKRAPSEELMLKLVRVYGIDESVLRSGFERPDAIVAEVASESPTAASKVPEFLRTARGLNAQQWDQLIEQARRLSPPQKEDTP
ncbi:MAG: helix-turn-helix transcriptional regulator [Phycisphaerales bacterium]